MRMTLSAIIVIVSTSGIPAADVELPATVVSAVRVYSKSLDDARAAMNANFDLAQKRLQTSNYDAETRSKFLEIVANEHKRFQESGKIPFSIVMQRARDEYLTTILAAQVRLDKAYKEVIDLKLRQGKTDEARAVRESFEKTLNIHVVARWKHRPGRDCILYSTGRLNDPDARTTWTLSKNTLTLRWPTPSAPGGAWVDRCTIAPDGLTYNGRNQNGTTISGWYLE